MREGFHEGIKPVSVTGGAVSNLQEGHFVTDICHGNPLSATNIFHESYTNIHHGKSVSARVIRITLAKSLFFF